MERTGGQLARHVRALVAAGRSCVPFASEISTEQWSRPSFPTQPVWRPLYRGVFHEHLRLGSICSWWLLDGSFSQDHRRLPARSAHGYPCSLVNPRRRVLARFLTRCHSRLAASIRSQTPDIACLVATINGCDLGPFRHPCRAPSTRRAPDHAIARCHVLNQRLTPFKAPYRTVEAGTA